MAASKPTWRTLNRKSVVGHPGTVWVSPKPAPGHIPAPPSSGIVKKSDTDPNADK